MSNTRYLNSAAAIVYPATLGSTTLTTGTTGTMTVFYPAVPLREQLPAYRVRQYVRESLDFSVREVLTVTTTDSTGAYELVGTLRYNDDPQDLIAMVRAGLHGSVLVYMPSTSSTGTAYSCWMVAPSGDDVAAEMDRQRGSPGYEDVELTIRLRQTNSQSFALPL